MKPVLIEERYGNMSNILNLGIITNALTRMKHFPDKAKPLVVLEAYGHFRVLTQYLKEDCIQFIEPTPINSKTCLTKVSFDKYIIIFNIENIIRHLDKKEEFFIAIQELLSNFQCQLHLCDAWQIPSTFMKWVTTGNSDVELLACSSRRWSDIKPHVKCEFITLLSPLPKGVATLDTT